MEVGKRSRIRNKEMKKGTKCGKIKDKKLRKKQK